MVKRRISKEVEGFLSFNSDTAYFWVGGNWNIHLLVWCELEANLSRLTYQLICITCNLGMNILLTPYERLEEVAIFRTLILKCVGQLSEANKTKQMYFTVTIIMWERIPSCLEELLPMNAGPAEKWKHELFSNRVHQMLQPIFNHFCGKQWHICSLDCFMFTNQYLSVQYKSPGFLWASLQILKIYRSFHRLSSCCIYINETKDWVEARRKTHLDFHRLWVVLLETMDLY